MVCNKCGYTNKEGDLFCINCGNKLESEIQENTDGNHEVGEPLMNDMNGLDNNLGTDINSVDVPATEEESNTSNDTVIDANNIDDQIDNDVSQNNDSAINLNVSINEFSKQEINRKKGNKKFLIILILAILVVVIAILMFLFFGKSKNNGNNLFNENNLIRIEKNELYGYINTDGKVVIEPKYNEASNFQGNYAVVEENDTTLMIDKKGKTVLMPKSSYGIEYLSEYDVWIIDDKLYNGSLKQISEEGIEVEYESDGYFAWEDRTKKQGGIMNSSGKKTYTYNMKSDDSYIGVDVSDNTSVLKDKYCRISISGDKYAIVNCDTGKVIYDYTDDFIFLEDNNIFEISDKDTYKTLSELYIQNDKIIYQSENGNIELKDYYINEGYIVIDDDTEYETVGYIDIKEGKVVKERPSYEENELSSLSEWETKSGLTEFKCDSKYGIKNKEKIVVECDWEEIEYLDVTLYKYLESKGKSYVLGEKDYKTYLINAKNGKVVDQFNASYVNDSSYSTFIYYKDKETNKMVIYNLLTNKSLVLDKYDDYDLNSNYVTVEVGNKINYYNTDLKLIYTIDE